MKAKNKANKRYESNNLLESTKSRLFYYMYVCVSIYKLNTAYEGNIFASI